MKRYINLFLKEETIQMFRQLAKESDKKQNALFEDMLQAYLILNAKDRKDDN